MKIETYKQPVSGFLSTEKDMALIVNMILKNDNLKRMLHYTTRDCLSKPKLTEEQSLELFGKNIKIVPRIKIEEQELNYILINFTNFTPNETNPEFRNNIIMFDILCHWDQWQLKDFQLRPYKIAAELDSMFNNRHLSGIGELKFLGADNLSLGKNLSGLCLIYQAIHGGEDKKKMPNPNDEAQFLENFNKMFNE